VKPFARLVQQPEPVRVQSNRLLNKSNILPLKVRIIVQQFFNADPGAREYAMKSKRILVLALALPAQ
jgi:hypothetical protein